MHWSCVCISGQGTSGDVQRGHAAGIGFVFSLWKNLRSMLDMVMEEECESGKAKCTCMAAWCCAASLQRPKTAASRSRVVPYNYGRLKLHRFHTHVRHIAAGSSTSESIVDALRTRSLESTEKGGPGSDGGRCMSAPDPFSHTSWQPHVASAVGP
jgi:hypothetical protein